MRYFDSARDSRDAILDHYTGVGEVLAIHALDRTFGLLHRQIRVKRGSLLSLDDVKNNDMIFVGSPAENLTLREIPSTQDFVFRRLDSGPRKGDLAIMNVHPQSGEAEYWVGSPSHSSLERRLFRDCAGAWLESREVGPDSCRHHHHRHAGGGRVCVSAEFARGIVAAAPGFENTGELKPFEAVLRVKVTRGVPVESEIVALREPGKRPRRKRNSRLARICKRDARAHVRSLRLQLRIEFRRALKFLSAASSVLALSFCSASAR